MLRNSLRSVSCSFSRISLSLLALVGFVSCGTNETNSIASDELSSDAVKSEITALENGDEGQEEANSDLDNEPDRRNTKIPLMIGRNEFHIEQTINNERVTRSVIIHLPSEPLTDDVYPVVFGFHGNGGTPQSVFSLLDRYVNANQIIAIYPEGYLRSWNLGAEESTADELEFIDNVMMLLDQYPEMRGRKFAVGLSNGAALGHYLAAETDYFAGIATFVSPLIVGFEPSADTKPVTVIQISGEDDKLIPYEGGLSAVGHNFYGAVESATIWASHNNCQIESVTEDVLPDVTLRSYEQCDDSVVVHDYTASNVGHNLGSGLLNSFIERAMSDLQITTNDDSVKR